MPEPSTRSCAPILRMEARPVNCVTIIPKNLVCKNTKWRFRALLSSFATGVYEASPHQRLLTYTVLHSTISKRIWLCLCDNVLHQLNNRGGVMAVTIVSSADDTLYTDYRDTEAWCGTSLSLSWRFAIGKDALRRGMRYAKERNVFGRRSVTSSVCCAKSR